MTNLSFMVSQSSIYVLCAHVFDLYLMLRKACDPDCTGTVMVHIKFIILVDNARGQLMVWQPVK